MTRRKILRRAAVFASVTRAALAHEDINLASALRRVKPPVFPNREFDIRQFGAREGSSAKSTDAIAKAISECHRAGGGKVLVPKGAFLTGAVHLLDNVNLHLSDGATLLFSTDPEDYPLVLTRYEGVECRNYSPFVYAYGKSNIAITGPGTLDGQASPQHWWPWVGKPRGGWKEGQPNMNADRKALFEMGERDVPVNQRVFGQGHYLRPNFVQPYRCTSVLLEGFTVVNSPMWELNPVLCQNVTVRDVRIDSHGPNNDGCDPESCRDVLIENCIFSTGDDCIAIKSGRNRDGRRVNIPCENVIVCNCQMKDGHGGVSIGSEVSGGIRNVFVDNCRMSSPNLERALRIKTNSYRGGTISNVHFENNQVGEVKEAVIEVDFYYEEGPGGPFQPRVDGVHVANVQSVKSKFGVFLRGFPNAPISGVTITNCDFRNAEKGNLSENVRDVRIDKVLVNGNPIS